MILTYFKIWLKVIKKCITFKYLSIVILVFLPSLFLIYLLLGKNILTSLIGLFILVIIILFVRLFIFYKKIIDLGLFNSLKLKPVDPLFGLLIYNRNPADIFILLPILIYIKIKRRKG
jgi:hypothetical protein